MPSPSTSTLRSGTVSRFSGGGALEKFSMIRFGACCWNGANRSPPNQPPPNPPPLLRGGCGRGGPPKLKNCAEAGPTIPNSSASATASAISGPVSVNTRKKDFVFGMRLGRNGSFSDRYNNGIRPQAGRFPTLNRASAVAVKGAAKTSFSGPAPGLEQAFQRPLSRSSTSEEANPSAGAPIEAALHQKLLQFEPLGARQFPCLPWPWLHERRAAAQTVGEVADRQRIGFRRIVFHDHPEILQHQEARSL